MGPSRIMVSISSSVLFLQFLFFEKTPSSGLPEKGVFILLKPSSPALILSGFHPHSPGEKKSSPG
jgi:hypothetical protein